MVRTILFVVAFATEKAPLFLAPSDYNHVISKAHPTALTRSAAVAVAHALAMTVALPGVDPSLQCMPVFESVPAAGDPLAGVDRVVALPLRQAAAIAAFSVSHLAAAGWSWAALALLAGTLAFPLATFALARIRTYRSTASPEVLHELFAAQSRYRSLRCWRASRPPPWPEACSLA